MEITMHRLRAWVGFSVAVIGLAGLCSADDVDRRQIGQMVLEGIPQWDESLRARMLQYLESRRATVTDIGADGKSLLVSTRLGNTNQLHVVAAPLGMRRQITFFDEPVNAGRFVPGSGGKKLVFSKDIGGNEQFQFHALDLGSGRHTLLTDGKSRHESFVLSPDGKRLAYAGNGRNGKDLDIYLRDMAADGPGKIAWEVDGSYNPVEFSPDGTKLLVLHYVSEKETNWHILDAGTGKHWPITPDQPAAYYGGGAWSADGKALYLTTDREGEFRKLYCVKLDDQQWTCLTKDIEWDVEDVSVEPTGKGIAFVVNEDGLSRLYYAGNDGSNRKAVSGMPAGVIGGTKFNETGGTLMFTFDAATSPADGYTATYPDGKVARWTESEIGGLNAATFVEPTIIRFPSFDQVDGKPRSISAFYFKGRGEGPRPVIIAPHGGPEAQFQPIFSSTLQFWAVEMGISVIAPNVRGSTGYGKTFHQLDNAVKREDSVKDIGALLDWIARQPELDAKRVGIYGGSYGGYMVLAALTNYPDRIKAGIDVVGIADFVSFLERTAEYRRDLRRAEYGDERIPDVRKVLESIAPLRNAEKIKSALFVAHGKNDPRVPLNEAEQIVAKMRELKRPVWFVNALDEGHGFQKKPNRDLASVLYAFFWQEHLLK